MEECIQHDMSEVGLRKSYELPAKISVGCERNYLHHLGPLVSTYSGRVSRLNTTFM